MFASFKLKLNFLLLGVSLALGILSKYAAGYIVLSFFISILINRDCRFFFLKKSFLITLITILILILPNLIWNYKNNFVTFAHTASNANLSSLNFSLIEGLNFIFSQILIFGLIPILYLFRQTYSFQNLNVIQKILLICFLFPIFIVFMLAIFSRANANWAVVGYPFACILLPSLLVYEKKVEKSIFLFNQFLFSFIIIISIIFLPLLGFDPFSNVKHVKPLSEIIRLELRNNENVSLMSDDREDYTHMLYYLRDIHIKKAKWNGDSTIDDHYELTTDYNDLKKSNVLLLTRTKPTSAMLEKSDSYEKINSLIYFSNNKKKTFNIYLLKNWK